MAGGDVWSKLRNLDAYPKTLEDFRVKTFSGAAISIVAILLIVVLFTSELVYYLSTEVEPELFVDTSRDEKMRINVDVTFHKMACAFLHLDIMDVSGENELDVEHDIFKQRLTETGTPIYEEPEEVDDLGDESDSAVGALKMMKEGLDPNRCESCYGAESEQNKCCNTCEAVREAYRRKGWALTDIQGIEQCEREGWTEKLKAQAKEGCRIYGHLEVNKVAGNFHIAPGKSFQQHSIHFHDLNSFGREALGKFNMSHTINHLSFGIEYPGVVNPLDGHSETADKLGATMYQYYVKIVPTRYRKARGQELNTNQYSVTMHQRHIDHKAGQTGLPGMFVMFEISPILVQLSERTHSFFHFLTGVLAIIGGIFSVAGMIDSFVYHGLRSLKKKQELGKLG
ncbi:intermediate compartment protein 3 [Salpingoeca rosetta]|uniref:Intermediate compartment protein 3 n=1 Tax=Salpingoeca rosetta (strain ATCC 50818 / BSB-021) TaxID=946362 RepID=F2UQC8_SALR5|nr:intermediate compartment protein 3 [Salpingoeca rosetta]EGD79796.1 intermediate compartment protein 3 [Salpingoeca rosetta]|eukprot:XP_004988745.1 intermediate compartment protein 3 [Salpingoeca rosetta]